MVARIIIVFLSYGSFVIAMENPPSPKIVPSAKTPGWGTTTSWQEVSETQSQQNKNPERAAQKLEIEIKKKKFHLKLLNAHSKQEARLAAILLQCNDRPSNMLNEAISNMRSTANKTKKRIEDFETEEYLAKQEKEQKNNRLRLNTKKK